MRLPAKKMTHPEISEAERFPLLTAAGRRLLHAMREDPQAPRWNWPNGEQLDAAGLERVQAFAAGLETQPVFGPAELPEWLPGFVDCCLEDVPFYRRRTPAGTPFASIPSCTRDDLAAAPWQFVPDSQPLERLIVFSSSGTTGHPAKLPTHPATAACGLPLLEHALAPHNVRFPRGPEQMALTNIVAYRGAYTTAIVVAWLYEAGCTRLNLVPDDWRLPGDCRAYLDRWHAPVVLGDPLAFLELDRVGLEQPPQALVSSIATLSDALADDLRQRYGCPVLDVYALTEAGIIGVKTTAGFAILPHDLYVEILDEHDEPCPPGVRGEVTLTGGRNPFGPLLRYRTGDFAALGWQEDRPVLAELEGRPPVIFPTPGGRIVHSMEVSRALRRFPLAQFSLHQDADGAFHFVGRGAADADELRDVLLDLLGRSCVMHMSEVPAHSPPTRKWLAFHSDITPPALADRR